MGVFLVDTNMISAVLQGQQGVIKRLRQEVAAGSRVLLSRMVDFEVRRGFAHKPHPKKEGLYARLKGLLEWCEVEPEDWEWSIQSFARARRRGKTPKDADLLVAAQATRTKAVVVSRDVHFDHLEVPRAS